MCGHICGARDISAEGVGEYKLMGRLAVAARNLSMRISQKTIVQYINVELRKDGPTVAAQCNGASPQLGAS